MKNYRNEVICPVHKLSIIKINPHTHRLICSQCQSENEESRLKRIQIMRVKLNASFTEHLNQLKAHKVQCDRFTQMFLHQNMMEAKRKIKKQLPAAQNTIKQILQNQIDAANRKLKLFIDKLMKPWNNLDANKLQLNHLEFEKAYPKLVEDVEQKKRELKEAIGEKLKIQMRKFYTEIFGF